MVGGQLSVIHCFPLREIAALGINRCPTHNSPMDKLYYERADYSVVVKNRAPPPKAWRWRFTGPEMPTRALLKAENASAIWTCVAFTFRHDGLVSPKAHHKDVLGVFGSLRMACGNGSSAAR
jgi:hypothetical protein